MTAASIPTLTSGDSGFRVEAYERLSYSLDYTPDVFDVDNNRLADIYRGYGRCLMVVDENVHRLYGEQFRNYFEHHGIRLTTFPLTISETRKTLATAERIVDAFGKFGLVRTEPVLVVGGGLTTDVAGFACAIFRRSTNYVRIPTTLIGLIDASVAIKVAVNHGRAKNRLGAFHASQQVLLDFSFLRTLPAEQIRNGMAELVKISTVGNKSIFQLLEKHGEELLRTRFGHVGPTDIDGPAAIPDSDGARVDGPDSGGARAGIPDSDGARAGGSAELREIAGQITYEAIRTMLELEVPNLHELDLDRVIAFGHTWSPALELAPATPFFHGHAIAIDMALSTTIAELRGYIPASERDRILWLLSNLGLSLDSPHLNAELLHHATESIVQTRDGLQRAATPRPIGTCHFMNDLTPAELENALAAHRRTCRMYPRNGLGLTPFVAPEPDEEPEA
jgi:demethyl-4-deoxygadusol synthase